MRRPANGAEEFEPHRYRIKASYSDLARATSCSTATVRRNIRELVGKRSLVVEVAPPRSGGKHTPAPEDGKKRPHSREPNTYLLEEWTVVGQRRRDDGAIGKDLGEGMWVYGRGKRFLRTGAVDRTAPKVPGLAGTGILDWRLDQAFQQNLPLAPATVPFPKPAPATKPTIIEEPPKVVVEALGDLQCDAQGIWRAIVVARAAAQELGAAITDEQLAGEIRGIWRSSSPKDPPRSIKYFITSLPGRVKQAIPKLRAAAKREADRQEAEEAFTARQRAEARVTCERMLADGENEPATLEAIYQMFPDLRPQEEGQKAG